MIISFISILLFLIFWQISTNIFSISKWILPAPSDIFLSFTRSFDLFWLHTGRTLEETLLGLFIAVIFGFLIGLLIDVSGIGRKIVYPFILLSQTVPFITLAPLLVIWFGFGVTAKIIIIALVCFFPISISVHEGLYSTDKNMIKLLKSMGAGKISIYKLVKIPSSLPQFFAGLKMAASYAMITAVVSEWIGSDKGLGILLIRSSKSYLTDRTFAVIIVISALTLLLVKIIDIISKFALPWYYKN